jgi:glucose-1-phosphatase
MRARFSLWPLHAGAICVAGRSGARASRHVGAIPLRLQDVARGPYPGALELLEGLRPQYRVACLSNTDAVNVRKFDEEIQLQNWFDECFYSNEMGVRKPDPEAYLRVSKSLEMPPNEIAFFDDSMECVNGAIVVGMHGHHVTGFGHLRIRLSELGILPGGPRHPWATLG